MSCLHLSFQHLGKPKKPVDQTRLQPIEFPMAQLTGPHLRPLINALARLRITLFREWPYLYDGSFEYERKYLQTYIESPEAVAVLVFHPDVPKSLSAEELAQFGDQLIGASTGLPLSDETAELRQPFEAAGHDPGRVFYFGESLLLPEFRGHGIGHRFFDCREAFARALGHIDICTFCAVQRPEDHPARPADYQPLDAFWTGRGYAPDERLQTTYRWQDVGEKQESAKLMQYWLRQL